MEMILMDFPPAESSTSRIFSTSSGLRTNDAAIKSTSCTTPKPMMSCRSFSVIVGRSTFTPGRLQFLRSPSVASFRHSQRTVPSSTFVSSTWSMTFPSLIRMLSPQLRSLAMCEYDTAIRSALPTTL